MAPLLAIKNLSVQFTQEGVVNKAVNNCSLQINRGELVAIVGESGSGKSVTALSILQLLPKQSFVKGEILFHSADKEPFDLLLLTPHQLRSISGNQIAMIFQEPATSLNPVFTCGQQVIEAIQIYQKISKKNARLKTIELFSLVELPNPATILDRYPHQLSGGQQQRVMIAMAMSCNPALLIADEPTTALDVSVQKNILTLIASLQKKNNMGVLFITHDLGIVADIADKIVVLHNGNVVEQGIAAAILKAPQHPYTKALLACRPAGKPKKLRLPVVSDFIENKPFVGKERKQPSTQYTDQPAILSVKNLRVSFPEKKNLFGKPLQFFNAVDDISFSVNKGETIGLVGESGCGKTTVGRAILQLIQPTAGAIYFNGQDLSQVTPSVLRQYRQDLQIVFQDPYGSLNPRITIGHAIMEPLMAHHQLSTNQQRKEKVIDLLEKVSLPADHFNRYPHQFSGGQRQRICIARALATDPSFLIFDESVSALDVSVQAQVINLLTDLKNEFGFSAIFISHDLSVVHYCCNRILVMQKGRIVEEGEASQVYFHPKHPYTQTLIEAIPGKSLFGL